MTRNMEKPTSRKLTIASQSNKILFAIVLLTSILCLNLVSAVEGDFISNFSTAVLCGGACESLTANGSNIYAMSVGGSVNNYDNVGNYVDSWSAGVANTYGITMNTTFFWVNGDSVDQVYQFNADGTSSGIDWDTSGQGTTIYSLANYGNYVYVPNSGTGIVYRYYKNGTYSSFSFDVSSIITDIDGITTNGNYFWMVSDNLDRVYKYDMVGNYVSNFSVLAQSTDMRGIANNGTNLLTLSRAGNSVYKYELEGAVVSSLVIDLISPLDGYASSSTENVFIVNYTATSYTLKNSTYYIWYSNSTIYNSTTYSINSSNVTKQRFTNFTLDNYEWNVFACAENATSTYCIWADANYSFTVGASLNSITYPNQTYETARETFKASFTILNNSEISLGQLIYNGTNYTISNITYVLSSFNISRTIDIPLNKHDFINNETREFYFRFVYAGNQVQVTDTYYHNVSFIKLQRCNTTYSTTGINFTYYDELLSTEIDATKNATSIQTTFQYWLGNGSVYKNYSYNNLTNNAADGSQYKFCIYPTWETFKVDADLDYEAEAYSSRTYHLRNAVISNITNEIKLNLLTVSDSVKFFISVKKGLVPFTDAIVTISKYFTGEGVYRTIGIRETDDLGEFIEYLDLDKKYKFFISKNGTSYGTITAQASCEAAPCELKLQIDEGLTDTWQGYYDIYATNVAYSLTFNDTTKIVTYTFNDLTGLAQYFQLTVVQLSSNQTGNTICDNTLYSTSGTLNCNVTGYTGNFKATGYISRSPPLVVRTILFVNEIISDVFGQLGILVSLFLIITIALVGSWNPAVGVILVAFSVFMMQLLGFAAFSYTTVILVVIIAIILAMKMKT